MEEQLLTLLQKVRDDRDEAARTELNELLRKHPEARTIMAKILVDEQALVSHLRDESIVSILDAEGETSSSLPTNRRTRRPLAWPQQITAGLVAGVLVGLLGVGMVWATGSPEAVARVFRIAHGNFESLEVGPIPNRFPVRFGEWCGNPAEVIEQADGNRELRFLETANVTGNPNGGASACNVFQLIDLSTLQQQRDAENSEAQITLEVSARFRREAAPTDAELPKLKGTCTIYLFQAEPEMIGKAWPHVIRDAVASRNKAIRLEPGDESGTISASCILEPEATIALLSVNVNTMTQSKTPIPLGGYFVDDVQLIVIKQPTLPVRFVK
jgi:hypothetical protein